LLTKRGRPTSANGWRWWRAAMVSANGATKCWGANACTTQTYPPTWTSPHAWRNCVDGGGIRFGAMFEGLVMSPRPLPWINTNGCAFFSGLLTTPWRKWQTPRME
jgi:hypothetical protein